MKYDALRELVQRAEAQQISLGEVILRDEAEELGIDRDEVFQRMRHSLHVMQESVQSGMEKDLRSTSGLTGGDAWKMNQRMEQNLTGPVFVSALTKAIAVSETNACMGRIVAAPTAGIGGNVRRHPRHGGTRLCHRTEKCTGTRMRSGSRIGGDPLHQTKRHGNGECLHCGGNGSGWD